VICPNESSKPAKRSGQAGVEAFTGWQDPVAIHTGRYYFDRMNV
jgi:hypothetical protein